ncbi:TetR/AcrR family transcriptional regulator [Microtetraspora sp. AC03309]|uniref:TetR/AcrR family transcriptional regulator n=1 Tax=Microtetraspora sp. AC03309 TaxID=2779376 RepID=UPI001E5B1CBD|nr:TetR/AcrR family transcriptional regulator [Microtetraspora sp. AC03309]
MTEKPDTPPRRRAPGMTSEQRRAMIVAAALPLVAENGAAVTTSQIARAAGIGEATIFRAFKDKDDVLDACVAEAVNPDHVLRELASIPLDQPLSARLIEAAEALRAHLARIGAVIGSLHASGHGRGRSPGDRPPPGSREASMRVLGDAVAELIEPDRDALRLEPGKVASIFLGMPFTRLHPTSGGAEATVEDFVGVLLHGALNDPGSVT